MMPSGRDDLAFVGVENKANVCCTLAKVFESFCYSCLLPCKAAVVKVGEKLTAVLLVCV